MAKKTKGKNKGLQWMLGLGLAVMLILITTIAVDLIVPRPSWNEYCGTDGAGQICDYDGYNKANDVYGFNVFLSLSIIGTIFVVASFFINILFVEIATTVSGLVLMIIALARNFDNKVQVLISSVVLLVLLVVVGIKKLKK